MDYRRNPPERQKSLHSAALAWLLFPHQLYFAMTNVALGKQRRKAVLAVHQLGVLIGPPNVPPYCLRFKTLRQAVFVIENVRR
jgi:hypothetical protein